MRPESLQVPRSISGLISAWWCDCRRKKTNSWETLQSKVCNKCIKTWTKKSCFGKCCCGFCFTSLRCFKLCFRFTVHVAFFKYFLSSLFIFWNYYLCWCYDLCLKRAESRVFNVRLLKLGKRCQQHWMPWLTWKGWGFCVPAWGCCCPSGPALVAWQAGSQVAESQSAHCSSDLQAVRKNIQNTHRAGTRWWQPFCRGETKEETSLTLISGRLRISGKTVIWFECAMRVCSLLQLDTVEGIVFSLFPLKFSSSSSSSLLSLLETEAIHIKIQPEHMK